MNFNVAPYEPANSSDYSKLKIEILQTLRGPRTTLEMSQKLGFKFNKYKRWEEESKHLKWDEFCEICDVTKAPVGHAFKVLFRFSLNDDETQNIFPLIRSLFPEHSLTELAKLLRIHPSAVKRHARLETYPELEMILMILDYKNLLSRFLLLLFANKPVPAAEYKDLHNQIYEVSRPITAAVEACLGLEAYSQMPEHNSKWIAKLIGISVEEVDLILKNSIENGTILKSKKHYQLNYNSINTSGVSPEMVCQMVKFWTDRASLRFMSEDQIPINKYKNSVVSYRIAPMSAVSATKISNLIREMSLKILDILEKDTEPKTDVRVVLMHHLSIEDRP